MAKWQEANSIELLRAEGERRASAGNSDFTPADFDDHVATYRAFLRWGAVFLAHVAIILVGMAIFLL